MTSPKTFLRMLKNRSGATVIEYCLIAGIISIAIVGWASMIGDSTNNTLDAVQAGFNS
jgi:Flp pilus assembly pilin Flp